ncbi:MAG: hypothetical protein E6K65_03050 [Nitrospirae bacterium]|nr:MAG: hypothetical protein E6K65_03050 [Nitrospirota bacterium]
MLITTGKVLGGTIKVDATGLPEGAIVTVLAPEGNETFELKPEEEASSSQLSRRPSEERRQARHKSCSRFADRERSLPRPHRQQRRTSYCRSRRVVDRRLQMHLP